MNLTRPCGMATAANSRTTSPWPRWAFAQILGAVGVAFAAACSQGFIGPKEASDHAPSSPSAAISEGQTTLSTFSREELQDSKTCGACHEEAYRQWHNSPHAAAADDPVFLAMNRMAQRETHGAIGSFCVQCHAPMAVHNKATLDGLNMSQVPRALRGVTCYFCHDAKSVAGNHNNPVKLADGTTMFGPIADPVANLAHKSSYSALHDRNTLGSSALCGSCHDIVTPPGAPLENTYREWQQSVYAHPVTGQSCSGCHMPQSVGKGPISDGEGAPSRYRHAHSFPGLDLPLPHPPSDGVATEVQDVMLAQSDMQALLDKTLQSALCVKQVGNHAGLRVVLDNVGAGHAFTSGAVQDRRLWAEVRAYKDGQLRYQSGVVPEGSPVLQHLDDDIWLVRSCMYDQNGLSTNHFWQAKTVESNPLPTINTFNVNDANFYRSNVVRAYPKNPTKLLDFVPDKVTLRIMIEPIGLDLLDELVQTGDLSAEVRRQAQRLVVGPQAVVTWTPSSALFGYQEHGMPVRCASNSRVNLTGKLFDAPSTLRCEPRSKK